MKKVLFLTLLLTMLLCGCGKEPDPAAETAAPSTLPAETTMPAETAVPTEPEEVVTTQPELIAFQQVLEGRMPILRAASMESIHISNISLFLTGQEFPWGVERICVQDLDNDGVLDAVLEVSNYAGYVILQYQEDGIVLGHEIWYRAFQDLKTDGTYRGSGSSFNSYYWQYDFDGGKLLAERYEEDGRQYYFIGNTPTDAAAFDAFMQMQDAKPDALWYDSWQAFLDSLQ